MSNKQEIIQKVSDALVYAGSTFSEDKKCVYKKYIQAETNPQAKWTLEMLLENACIAEKNQSPLCDDTGIPHVLLDVGPNQAVTGEMMCWIEQGIREGLKRLPGRPMGLKGEDYERLEQSAGISPLAEDVELAPIEIRHIQEDVLRLHVLMFGGGPAIRGKTYRVFHKHDTQNIIDEIVLWAKESTALLGCTPCTLAVGIGRSHYEAASLMLQAMVDGSYTNQSKIEQEITERVNQMEVGPLGLGGNTTVLGTFVKVGAQRASGVRIVCMRPCCCCEPRVGTVVL